MSKAVAVIVPVYGRTDLTRAVLRDLERESDLLDVYVVDNAGDWQVTGTETVIRTGVNLRWVGGCNVGLSAAMHRESYRHFLLLNNDVTLSSAFCLNLVQAADRSGSDVVAAVYDDQSWPHQYVDGGPAGSYVPVKEERFVPFVDGNNMLLSRQAVETVGLLDSASFSRFGWGVDLDYALRIRAAGMTLSLTKAAYLNHLVGGSDVSRSHGWYIAAFTEMCSGLENRYGSSWESQLWSGFTPVKNIAEEFAKALDAEA